VAGRTVIVSGLPEKLRSRVKLLGYMRKEYPRIDIRKIAFCMKVADVLTYLKKRAFYQKILRKAAQHDTLYDRLWKSCCAGFLCERRTRETKSIKQYYNDDIKAVDMEIYINLKKLRVSSPLDTAFVTLDSQSNAYSLYLFHNFRRTWKPEFTMKIAPPAKSVIWENISPQYYLRLKEISVSLLLFLYVVSATLPELAADYVLEKVSSIHTFFQNQTVKSLYTLLNGYIAKVLVFSSSQLLGFWTERIINNKVLVNT